MNAPRPSRAALAGACLALLACGDPGATVEVYEHDGGTAAAGGTVAADAAAASGGTPAGDTCGDDPLLEGVLKLPLEGRNHVADGTPVEYAHNPPASGNHYGHWIHSGVYDQALDPRGFVHNLEHGWVVLLHRPDAPEAAVKVEEDFWFDAPADPQCPGIALPRILVTPAPDLPTPVAAVSWTRALSADAFDRATLEAFFRDCRGQAPEPKVCADGGDPVFR